jgi:hypothetical protein
VAAPNGPPGLAEPRPLAPPRLCPGRSVGTLGLEKPLPHGPTPACECDPTQPSRRFHARWQRFASGLCPRTEAPPHPRLLALHRAVSCPFIAQAFELKGTAAKRRWDKIAERLTQAGTDPNGRRPPSILEQLRGWKRQPMVREKNRNHRLVGRDRTHSRTVLSPPPRWETVRATFTAHGPRLVGLVSSSTSDLAPYGESRGSPGSPRSLAV